jgi:hypothetical protein
MRAPHADIVVHDSTQVPGLLPVSVSLLTNGRGFTELASFRDWGEACAFAEAMASVYREHGASMSVFEQG